MTSPTKDGSDTTDNALKNSKNETPNDFTTEPPSVDCNMICQVETNSINKEPGTLTSEEDAVPQAVENSELETEKIQKDSQKQDTKETEPLQIKIPIPRKLIFFMSGLGRIQKRSILLAKSDKNNSLTDRSQFNSGKMEIKTSNFFHSTMSHKIPFQLSMSWRIPLISNHDIRRMLLRLLCGRYVSQAAGHQNATWGKQKYIAVLSHPNIFNQNERVIIFGRPLRVYYYHPLIERMTSGKFYKSTNTKKKDGFHIIVRSVFCVPWTQIQDIFSRKAFENHVRSHHNMRIVLISTENGWKYLCPICGSSFSNLVEFRQHSCHFPEN
ncbi:CPX chromosomal region candidate gene 1 protein [Carlito syrichta]|uniref:CPX chromosomal region candidate gene 1 protein n=1 Tax=Carlito syrichta TaxID=1868482 RepID=A0A1U7TPA8_CARSF|nr:CPX chromosomal region candidate gene 1 protein [Carlito syrichta]